MVYTKNDIHKKLIHKNQFVNRDITNKTSKTSKILNINTIQYGV